jgi:hypothetical protein
MGVRDRATGDGSKDGKQQGRHFGDSFSTLLFTWLEIYAMRRFWRAAKLAATTELAIRGTQGMRP